MTQRSVPGRKPGLVVWLLLGVVTAGGLTACGSTSTGGTSGVRTDALTFDNTTIPVAYVGEPFETKLLVSGGVGPYAYKVSSGSLPPGMKYSSGVLSGTPTQAGSYKFTVEASDANLSNKVASYTLNVNELPPLSLELTLPPGEIRGETRVPVLVKAPRAARAARFTWDLGKDVQVTRVQATDSNSPVFWRQEGTVLSVDLGFKTVPRPGARVALVTVKPVKPVTLNATNFWFESRDGTGKVLGEKKRPAPAPSVTPATTTPTDAPKQPAQQPVPTEPGNAQPGTKQPGTEQPGTEQPGTGQPGTEQPAPGQPAPTQPGTGGTTVAGDSTTTPATSTPAPGQTDGQKP